MKNFLISLSFILISLLATAGEPVYDSVLAAKLGADQYGMKTYVLVILKTGNAQVSDRLVRDSLFAGHMQNIRRLADEGKLTVAGPLSANENAYRGIFILNTNSLDEAREWVNSDPVVEAQVMDAELYKWYGSAALPVYLEVHEKIAKKTH